jgi:acyl-CoA synthetase (AMP-forming)/AMP-acid ligase II
MIGSSGTVAGLLDAAEDFGGATAVLDDGERLTYTDLVGQVRAAAAGFAAAGVGRGDRVCVWGSNRTHWLVAGLGAQYAGAVLVPLNSRYRGREAADILARTGARLLVVEQGLLGTDYLDLLHTAGREGAGLPDLTTVVTIGASDRRALPWTAFLDAGRRVPPEQVRRRAAVIQPDDRCDIHFTSGTTGRPKGAVATHRQTLASARSWAGVADVTAADRYLIASPFFHSFGSKAGYLVCLLTGATAVPVAVFSAPAVLDLIEQERITVLPGAPALYQSLLDDPTLPGRQLGSLRLAVTGAATVPQVLVERMRSELGFAAVLTAYGLTEAAVVTMCRPGDSPQTVATTCGRAIDGIEIRIAAAEPSEPADPPDPSEPADPPDPSEHAGEVLVRGVSVMTGYLDDPAATADAIDPDGWLHTGDVGVMDAQGYLRITDRIKDMFTVGGFNVYPAEVEQVISRVHGVRECAVIGVPDHRLGEVARAFVSLSPGATVTAAEVIGRCRDQLANFKVPRSVVFVEDLPRNISGKILKTELRVTAEASS